MNSINPTRVNQQDNQRNIIIKQSEIETHASEVQPKLNSCFNNNIESINSELHIRPEIR